VIRVSLLAASFRMGAFAPPQPALLPPNERRRATAITRLALTVAHEAALAAGADPAALRTVFASANGDGATVTAILHALSGADGFVSPTQFHNSVHNAPSGYWSIATKSNAATTCLGGGADIAVLGLLKAATEVALERVPVLLCAYDIPLPAPLRALDSIDQPCAVAIVLAPPLAPEGGREIGLEYRQSAPLDHMLNGQPAANPAARLLPLLQAMEAGGDTVELPLELPLARGRLTIHLLPTQWEARRGGGCHGATPSPPPRVTTGSGSRWSVSGSAP
jgi:hypothetical protein